MSSKNLTEEIVEESSSDRSSGLVEYSIDVSSADKQVPRLKSVIHRVLEDQKSGRLNLDESRQPEEFISIHEENAQCTHVDFNFERQGSEISRMDRKFTDPSEACKVIQHFIRHHKLRKCLHRKNLGDRLIFEANLLRGFRRFLLQLLIFSTLLLSLIVSSNSAAKWGIYSNLRSEFNLDSILSVATRDDLESAIHSVSLVSKKFSTLSSLYFDPGTSGSIELISASESFLRPRLVAGLKLNIGTSFSFTAWIQTSPLFLRGYVVRKRLAAVGAGEPLSCWGWYLTSGAGPQLHFGAHDYFSTSSGSPIDGLAQHAVRLDGTAALRSGEQRLLTMVVTEDNVTFYQDLDVLGVVEMPRPMTDCYDGDEVLLGSAGLQISQVGICKSHLPMFKLFRCLRIQFAQRSNSRCISMLELFKANAASARYPHTEFHSKTLQLRFYPRALETSRIEEIFRAGSTLQDISTVCTRCFSPLILIDGRGDSPYAIR